MKKTPVLWKKLSDKQSLNPPVETGKLLQKEFNNKDSVKNTVPL